MTDMRWDISVVGGGDIGAAVTLLLAVRCRAQVTVVQDGGGAIAREGAVAAAMLGCGARVRAVDDLSQARGPAVAVVTTADGEELQAIAVELARHAPDAIVLAACEPADVACAILVAESAFPRARVLGVAAAARGARLRAAIAEAAGVWAGDVAAEVLGGPPPRSVPLLSRATISGLPAADVLGQDALARLAAEATGEAAAGGVHPAAAAACDAVEAVLSDQHRVLTCAVACRGELGLQDQITAVPVRVGRRGVEVFVEPPMTTREREALVRAAIRMR
jgi:malate dehydrogenase